MEQMKGYGGISTYCFFFIGVRFKKPMGIISSLFLSNFVVRFEMMMVLWRPWRLMLKRLRILISSVATSGFRPAKREDAVRLRKSPGEAG